MANLSRRTFFGFAGVGIGYAITLPQRLLGRGAPRHPELSPADATEVRDLSSVRRLLERTQIASDQVRWAEAYSADLDGGLLKTDKIFFFIIPVIGAQRSSERFLLVAPRTIKGHGEAAGLWDNTEQSALVAVDDGWLDFRNGRVRAEGVQGIKDGFEASCHECFAGAGFCCISCALPQCCAACGGVGTICCAINHLDITKPV